MRKASALAGAAAVILIGGGLTGSTRYEPSAPLLRGQVQPVAATGAPPTAAYGAADTRFGLRLLAQLDSTGQNVVFSPTSVASSLGMAYLGARGDTAAAMARALCLPATGQPGLAGMHDRTAALRGLPQVETSDTVWLDPSLPTRSRYLDRVATGYDNGVRQVPLLTDPAGSADTINDTVSTDTHGAIPRIVSAADLASVGWVFTDAVYLKADWQQPFGGEYPTEGGRFHGPHGTVTARYLHTVARFDTAHVDGWTAVALPYQGGRLQMLALLPDGTQTAPSPATLATLSRSLAPQTIDLRLPAVDLQYSTELSAPLITLGMGPAFGPGADFTALSPAAGPISFVNHRATLTVGEKGTEASAATATGNYALSAPIAHTTITFNHPYLMLIRDTSTNEPLFLAHITDPAE
jgi:serine protease inhibitor